MISSVGMLGGIRLSIFWLLGLKWLVLIMNRIMLIDVSVDVIVWFSEWFSVVL